MSTAHLDLHTSAPSAVSLTQSQSSSTSVSQKASEVNPVVQHLATWGAQTPFSALEKDENEANASENILGVSSLPPSLPLCFFCLHQSLCPLLLFCLLCLFLTYCLFLISISPSFPPSIPTGTYVSTCTSPLALSFFLALFSPPLSVLLSLSRFSLPLFLFLFFCLFSVHLVVC